MSRLLSLFAAAALVVTGTAGIARADRPSITQHRVVAYYQTQYDNGQYVSPLPLNGIATDIDVAALHLNGDGSVHLNDDPPSAAKFVPMWQDLATLQKAGIRVELMLGGAGVGSFANLHDDFAKFYPLLRDTLRTYHLDGIDIDIEEQFSLADTEHLIGQLRHDFGPSFVIAMAPVASDLSGHTKFSGGFSYPRLEKEDGAQISWYNTQFYCGWGNLSSTADYDAVIANGYSAGRVVAGTVTNPANCSGYVDPATLQQTISALTAKYQGFGGVAGWEYFNGLPDPRSWYRAAQLAMR